MKKIKGWEWNETASLYIQEGLDLSKGIGLGTDKHGDVINKNIYNPRHSRLYNSFEQAQVFRFQIAVNWAKIHFQDLEKKEEKKRMKVVTDFGCSRSFWYQYWRYQGNYFGWPLIYYQGVDINLKRIQEGRESFVPKKNDRLVYFLGNLSSQIKMPNLADVIICLEVIEHIDPEKVHTLLNTLYNGLKSTGLLILSSPNPKKIGTWVWENSPQSHHYEYTFSETKDLLKKSGFKIVDHTGVLPDRNYFKSSSFPKLRKRLCEIMPAPLVNNFLLLAEKDIQKKRQWILKAKKI